MQKQLKLALLGLLTGYIGSQGVSIVYAACELGCQESEVWRIHQGDEHCEFNSLQQAREGHIAEDKGEFTKQTQLWNQITICPIDHCRLTCPAKFGLPSEAIGSTSIGCRLGETVPVFTCEIPAPIDNTSLDSQSKETN